MGKITIISALFSNDVINNRGRFPWNFSEYRNAFIEVMKTGNYILTDKSTSNIRKKLLDDCEREFMSIDPSEVEETIKNLSGKDVFIFGGKGLYESSSKLVDTLMLARINYGGNEGEIKINPNSPRYSDAVVGKKRLEEDLKRKKERNLGEDIGLRFPINYKNQNSWKLIQESENRFNDHRYFDVYKKIA